MTPVGGGEYASPTTPQNGAGNGSTDNMANFYNEVTSIQDSIAQFSGNVSRISDLHSRTLNSTDDNASRQNEAVLDDLVGQTRQLSTELKERIQTLSSYPVTRAQDQAIRKNQTALLRQKFVEVLQNYQQVERDYRAKYRQRVERQFKIVKPDATPEEVAAVVNDTNGAGAQIFTQALSSSTRYGESRTAYREVQDRHNDIQKIERTLEELAQLFNDMSVLVAQQDEAIDQINTMAGDVEADTGAGLKETEIAVKHARSARRKRWICFIIAVIVVLVLALVLGLHFGLQKNNTN
ncbi:t-SNARE [Trametes versicolor FP-101664 SS1]|uniref:t-SNARE n=1 Tax=Trametes versicolor (strain FP-101664) TaxID=717944 RepID=UPI0004623EB4|nr:t-SNARE [Trametes versicolor FP-101664 SS1]EIW60013.1 t-SNARE [Trametes versicolor FP-101664 SS1]